MNTLECIAEECRYSSKYIKVNGSNLHYIEAGSGDPILFIHGMPTSSYLWRNIIPQLSDRARCIAPDLIGMGASDKPNIEYRVFDHIDYIEKFIKALNLKNITLVLHGWGSVIGFDYARRNEINIKAIAFYESHVRNDTDWKMLSLPIQHLATLLNRQEASYRAIVQQNYLVNKVLQNATMKTLSAHDLEEYRKPFPTAESRKPLWQYIRELPLGNGQTEVTKLISNYSTWLQNTSIPKLMIYALPGFMTTMETVQWAKQHFKNLTLVGIDHVLHFAQESSPDIFGEKLREWYLCLSKAGKR